MRDTFPKLHLAALPGPGLRLALGAVALAPAVAGAGWGLAGPGLLPGLLALGGYLAGLVPVLVLFRRGYPHARLGLCNAVTLGRLALAAVLLAPLAGGAAPGAVAVVALVALALDGADGWLARREGLVSGFGARLDMEVDSALALILAANAWAAGTVGPAVLLLGLPRYAFAAAGLRWGWLDGPLPPSLARKAVCVVQIGALIVLQLPGLPGGWAEALVWSVLAALAWSFGRDIRHLWQARA
jgi:phosphatidylglycerophosphate synthase